MMIRATAILLCLLPAALPEREGAVDDGRDALSRRWRYPWYDAENDGMRRIDVREETPPPESSHDRSGSSLPQVLQLLGWAGIALLLGLMLWLILAAWGTRGRDDGSRAGPEPRAGPNHVEAMPVPGISAAVGLLDEARRLYEQGDFSRAVVCLFAHELLELDRMQIVRLSRGKTNRQYLREVGRRTALKQLVEQTMVAFEDVFFGNQSIDRARFESCWTRLPEFDALVQGGAA